MSLEDLQDEFMAWHESIKGEAEEDAELFREALSEDPIELHRQLQAVERVAMRSGKRVAKAQYFLSKFVYAYSSQYQDLTPTEKKIKVASDAADYTYVRDSMENISSVLRSRLMAAESLLKLHQPFMMKGIS